MRTELDKYIELRPKRDGRLRPFIAGTGVEVQFIVKDSEVHNLTPDEIARGYAGVSLAQVHAALAFFHDNRDEMRRMMFEDEELVRRLKSQPIASHLTGPGSDATSSPVSP
jgi:uncharacterized protein (DUF433 family)